MDKPAAADVETGHGRATAGDAANAASGAATSGGGGGMPAGARAGAPLRTGSAMMQSAQERKLPAFHSRYRPRCKACTACTP